MNQSQEVVRPALAVSEQVYRVLRSIAHQHLADNSPGSTLGTTALVHESYLRLAGKNRYRNVSHQEMLCLAARAMRSVMVDHFRRRNAVKRRAKGERVMLDDITATSFSSALDLVSLNDSLDRLTELDPDLTRLVELRFFGGLSTDETADILNVSSRTVRRDWRFAKAWLRRDMEGEDSHA